MWWQEQLTNNTSYAVLTFLDLYNLLIVAAVVIVLRLIYSALNGLVAEYLHLNGCWQMYFRFCNSYSMFQIMQC